MAGRSFLDMKSVEQDAEDDGLATILSPKSPALTGAVFGSAPRRRRPSTPKASSVPAATPQTSQASLRPKMKPVIDKELPRTPSSAPPKARAVKRPDSPDVDTFLARTPRPRRRSSATFNPPSAGARTLRSRAGSTIGPSSWKVGKTQQVQGDVSPVSDYGTLLPVEPAGGAESSGGEGEGSETDSSIDLHTPLPHLMFRDGLLSPRSKLLPKGTPPVSLYVEDDDSVAIDRARSVLSVASTSGSVMTKTGLMKDPRDTARRRVRHRDGQLLRAGMGLTTGLGWSDSEDEDAPSTLTRRLITARQPSLSTASSRTPSQMSKIAPRVMSPTLFTSPMLAGSRSASAAFSAYRTSTADTDSVLSTSTVPRSRATSASSSSSASPQLTLITPFELDLRTAPTSIKRSCSGRWPPAYPHALQRVSGPPSLATAVFVTSPAHAVKRAASDAFANIISSRPSCARGPFCDVPGTECGEDQYGERSHTVLVPTPPAAAPAADAQSQVPAARLRPQPVGGRALDPARGRGCSSQEAPNTKEQLRRRCTSRAAQKCNRSLLEGLASNYTRRMMEKNRDQKAETL
ncbi:hypothetical protein A0H81_07223 [Grifola frondosa]|uniref:Uncharacterized protein n=1 Tax=Grifola frondosa TaxID=5627 RepID=A0A1C7M7T6_GRIFR|nr:hypothetical protein A0H81_07223 [Grifola frondosa]